MEVIKDDIISKQFHILNELKEIPEEKCGFVARSTIKVRESTSSANKCTLQLAYLRDISCLVSFWSQG